jgi:hypothetical protein
VTHILPYTFFVLLMKCSVTMRWWVAGQAWAVWVRRFQSARRMASQGCALQLTLMRGCSGAVGALHQYSYHSMRATHQHLCCAFGTCRGAAKAGLHSDNISAQEGCWGGALLSVIAGGTHQLRAVSGLHQ